MSYNPFNEGNEYNPFKTIDINDLFNPFAMEERDKEMRNYIATCAEHIESDESADTDTNGLKDYITKKG